MGFFEFKKGQNLLTWLNASFHLAGDVLTQFGPNSNIFANHNHSNLSDGMFSPGVWLTRTFYFIKILNELSKQKYGTKWTGTFNLNLSDHNTFKGSLEFLKEKEVMKLNGNNENFLDKIGSSLTAEITSAKGKHWLIEVFPKEKISVDSTIPEFLGYNREDWKKTEKYFDTVAKNLVNEKIVKGIAFAKRYFEDQNFQVLAIIPHPMVSIQSVSSQKLKNLVDKETIDGIEWLSWKSKLKHNKLHQKYINTIPLLSNSDSHDCILYALNILSSKSKNWIDSNKKFFDLLINNRYEANYHLKYSSLSFKDFSQKKTFHEVASLLHYVLNLQGWRELTYLPKGDIIVGIKQYISANY